MKKSICLLVAILCVVSCNKDSKREIKNQPYQLQTSQIDNSWILSKIDSTLKVNNIPALAIGFVNHDKLEVRGFGTKERGLEQKIDENSIFQIGSDTKKFTAIIVRNLIMAGQLELDKSISSYLPNSVVKEAKKKLEKITIRTLLLHRSGIPNRAPGNQRIDGDPMLIPYTENDLISDLNKIELDFEPDTEMSYSNFGYAVLGYLCELLSKKDYAELLKFYITDRYGMNNTFIYPSKEQLLSIATPYRKDDRNIRSQAWKMGKMTPAGSIYSSVADVSKLMKAQIMAYRAYIQSAEKDSPLLLTESDGIQGSHYGFGLAKNIMANWTRYGHGGDLDGFASSYVFSPEKHTGLIMLTSSGGRWFGALEKELKTTVFSKENTK